jgi:hypothetical protein
MNTRIFAFGICLFALSGCSSLNSLLSFEEEPAPLAAIALETPAAPPAAPAAPDEWCQRVAASERLRAQQSGFDAATLDRMTAQSYRQCMELGLKR